MVVTMEKVQKELLQEDRLRLEQQVKNLIKKCTWSDMCITGKIVNIRQGNGRLFIVDLYDGLKTHSVQCWNKAYEQMFKKQFNIDDTVTCIAWPSYYTNDKGKQCMSIKTDVLSKQGNVIRCFGLINSEWLKTTSLGKDIWQFTIKDFNGNGKIIHCNTPKTDTAMRIVAMGKGTPVEVVGNFEIVRQNDSSHRLVLNVLYMDNFNPAVDNE